VQKVRYDKITVTFHWLTAAIFLFMFTSPYIWRLFERRTPPRLELQFLHFSFGLLLLVILIARVVWRLRYGRALSAPNRSRLYGLALLAHYLLYAGLFIQIALGIWLRLAQNNPLVFFGLFEIPTPFDGQQEHRKVLAVAHDVGAWMIFLLSIAHALAALFHQFVLKDQLLHRVGYQLKEE